MSLCHPGYLTAGVEFVLSDFDEHNTIKFSDHLWMPSGPPSATKFKKFKTGRKRFIGICKADGDMTMETAMKSSLPILKYCKARKLVEKDVLRLVTMIAHAVEALHMAGVSHGGICASNVLVSDDDPSALNTLFLADRMALDTMFDSEDIEYRSPELFPGNPSYNVDADNRPSDVYALGILVAQIIIEILPHLIPFKLKRIGVRKDWKPERPSGLDKYMFLNGLWDLAERCFQRAMSRRLDMKQVTMLLVALAGAFPTEEIDVKPHTLTLPTSVKDISDK